MYNKCILYVLSTYDKTTFYKRVKKRIANKKKYNNYYYLK